MTGGVRHRWRGADSVNALRRRSGMWVDRQVARVAHRHRPPRVVPFDGEPRLALVTVNFSTTHHLKLMLATLADQHDVGLVTQVVIVDNASRDGGTEFLRRLAGRVPEVALVERSRWLHHGPAMRAGVRALDRLDAADPQPANVLLFCDPDVIFRHPDALGAVAGSFVAHDAALVGEVRSGPGVGPNIQASFFAVRRDVYARRDVVPLVHDGSPAQRHQASIAAAGLTVVDLPTNHGGLILHRGRAGVAAAARYYPLHPHATARHQEPHYMGVSGGAAIWHQVEQSHDELLSTDGEDRLIDLVADRLA